MENIKILIVEDEIIVAKDIEDTLEQKITGQILS